nr:hypothetical protein [Holospora undulata]
MRKRPVNEPNCSAFWCQRERCFEVGEHLRIKAMRQN